MNFQFEGGYPWLRPLNIAWAQESWVLWGLCPLRAMNSPCGEGMCHCTTFCPWARRHPISSHAAHCISLFTNTCGAEEFPCELPSTRKGVQKSFAHKKWRQREKRPGHAGDGSLQPGVPVPHCSEGISQPVEQYSKAAGKWVWNNSIATSSASLFSSQAQEFRCKPHACTEAAGSTCISHNLRSSSPCTRPRPCAVKGSIWGRTTYYGTKKQQTWTLSLALKNGSSLTRRWNSNKLPGRWKQTHAGSCCVFAAGLTWPVLPVGMRSACSAVTWLLLPKNRSSCPSHQKQTFQS